MEDEEPPDLLERCFPCLRQPDMPCGCCFGSLVAVVPDPLYACCTMLAICGTTDVSSDKGHVLSRVSAVDGTIDKFTAAFAMVDVLYLEATVPEPNLFLLDIPDAFSTLHMTGTTQQVKELKSSVGDDIAKRVRPNPALCLASAAHASFPRRPPACQRGLHAARVPRHPIPARRTLQGHCKKSGVACMFRGWPACVFSYRPITRLRAARQPLPTHERRESQQRRFTPDHSCRGSCGRHDHSVLARLWVSLRAVASNRVRAHATAAGINPCVLSCRTWTCSRCGGHPCDVRSFMSEQR